MFKIGLCGAHGTGKTTLTKLISEKYNLALIDRTMRNMWEGFGVSDFEKMPAELRGVFQKYAVLNQIQREDIEGVDGFVSDRTVLDNFVHVVMDSKMSEIDLGLYEALVKERIKTYTHFIYLPIEFEVENEYLRANIEKRESFAQIAEGYLSKWFKEGDYIVLRGSVEERMEALGRLI
jgi:deoxyadenosine/deoxycytidine kinase